MFPLIPTYEGLTRSNLAEYVRDHSALRNTSRVIAFVLALNYDPETGFSEVSYATLSRHSGISERNVFDIVRRVAASGEWGMIIRPGGLTTQYYPILDEAHLPDGVTRSGSLVLVTDESGVHTERADDAEVLV